MALFINTNVAALNAQGNFARSKDALDVSLKRLSTGMRINTSRDDASGLMISQRMLAQSNGMDQAIRNSNDAISFSQTAEGALGQMGDMLQRIRVLAVQSANGSNSKEDRIAMNSEVGELMSELQRFSKSAQFNGQTLLDGSNAATSFQVGANAGQMITSTTKNFQTSNYGIYQTGGSTHALAVAVGDTADYAGDANGNAFSGLAARALLGERIYLASNSAFLNNTEGAVMDLRGFGGTATVTGTYRDSAASFADKINSVTKITGVTATVSTQMALSFTGADPGEGGVPGVSGAYSVSIVSSNDITNSQVSAFNLKRREDGTLDLSDAASSINERKSSTGVFARVSDDGKYLVLNNTAGDNISLVFNLVPQDDGGNEPDINLGYVFSGADHHFVDGYGKLETQTAYTQAGQITLNSAYSFDFVARTEFNVNEGVMNNLNIQEGQVLAAKLQAAKLLDLTTESGATKAISILDGSLATVNGQRAVFGAVQARFQATINALTNSSENAKASQSRIADTDFTMETTNMTRAQILQQAGTAMLAQANQVPQIALSLLR